MCPTLHDPMDCSPPDSSVHAILQAEVLSRSGMSFLFPGDLPNPEIKPASLMSPALAGGFFTAGATWEVPNFCYKFSHTPTCVLLYLSLVSFHDVLPHALSRKVPENSFQASQSLYIPSSVISIGKTLPFMVYLVNSISSILMNISP